MVAHGNSIRALIKAIDGVEDEELVELEIPPCIPLVYRFEDGGLAGKPGAPLAVVTMERSLAPLRGEVRALPREGPRI